MPLLRALWSLSVVVCAMSSVTIGAARSTVAQTQAAGSTWNDASPVLLDQVATLVVAALAAGTVLLGALVVSALRWRTIHRRPPATVAVLIAGGLSLTALLILQAGLRDTVGLTSLFDQTPYRGALEVFQDYPGQLALWGRTLVGSVMATGASLVALIGLLLPDPTAGQRSNRAMGSTARPRSQP